jgi:Tol biopolymer transport system component
MIGNRTALTAAIVLLAALGDAHAAFRGGNGEVAFESNRAGGFDLYTVEADGTGTAVLVATTGDDRSPAWSPDGSRVAFQSNVRGNFDIWIVNADGTGLRALTSGPTNEIQPTWSPDGSRIAFARLDPALGTHDLWHVRAEDGSDPRNLTGHPGNDIRPAWSPDGGSIAFESHRDGNAEIYVVDVDAPSSSAVNLTRDIFEDQDPAWSPDGSRIAFVSDRDLFVWQIWSMDRSGSGASLVPGTEPGDREPAFSPDGTALAFTRNGDGGVEGIWRVSLDGTGLALLDAAPPFTRGADWRGIAAEPENGPPSAYAGPDGRLECVGIEGATVRLDGSGSSDPDSTPGTNDDLVAFEWFLDWGGPAERKIAEGAVVDVTLDPGVHAITLRVTDRGGLSDVDEAVWTLNEAPPLSLEAEVSPAILWPPNHRLIPVRGTVRVAEGACSESASVVLVSVTSSEPDDAPGAGDGKTRGDIAGADLGTADFEVFLRAERDGSGPGRTYTLTWAVVEGPSSGASVSAEVFVPHDEPEADPPAESGVRGAVTITRPAAAPRLFTVRRP